MTNNRGKKFFCNLLCADMTRAQWGRTKHCKELGLSGPTITNRIYPGRLRKKMTFEQAVLTPVVEAHRNPRKPRTKCVFCGKKVPPDEYYTNKHRNCYAAARQRGWRAGMPYSDFAKQADEFIRTRWARVSCRFTGPTCTNTSSAACVSVSESISET
jgi:hypothetical protein